MKKETIEILKEACKTVRLKTTGVAGTASGNRKAGRGAGGDISTRLDLLAERTVLEIAKKNGMDTTIIAEESGLTQGNKGFLVIDAIDGTTNAGRSIPFYCCSIAYSPSYSLSSITDASIINLATGELYWASAGKGSYFDSRRLHVSKDFDSIVAIDISGITEESLAHLSPAITSIKHARQFGSAALELCLLARGMLDACIDFRDRIRPTDIAAGYLIAKEAGASFYAKDGSELDCPLAVENRLSFFAATQNAYEALGPKLFQERSYSG